MKQIVKPSRICAAAALLALPGLAVACAAPPGPRGWSPPRPALVAGQEAVLVPHKDRLFALRDESSDLIWQFPPRNREQRDAYPLSDQARDAIRNRVRSSPFDDGAKGNLDRLAGDLAVSGATIAAFKDAVDAARGPDASGDRKQAASDIKKLVDDAARREERAVKQVRALYGAIGLSANADTAYVPSFGGWLFALDMADGHLRWVLDAGAPIVGGVTVDGATVYFGTRDGDVFALDAASGERRWRIDAGAEVWAAPTAAGGALYVSTLKGRLMRLDPATGDRVWQFSSDSGIASRPVVGGGAVYVGSFDSRLYSVDAASGKENWSFEADNWFWGDAVIDGDAVIAASLDGNVYAIAASSGNERWRFDAGSPVRSTPVLAGGALVVAARDAEVFKINLDTGAQEGAPVEAGDKIEADLAVRDNRVYVMPRASALFILDASGDLTGASYPLPR